MRIIEWPVTFQWQGKTHTWRISFQETLYMPEDLQVYDEKNYYTGALKYYPKEDRWRFFYKNQDNVQELADILGEFVVKWYQ